MLAPSDILEIINANSFARNNVKYVCTIHVWCACRAMVLTVLHIDRPPNLSWFFLVPLFWVHRMLRRCRRWGFEQTCEFGNDAARRSHGTRLRYHIRTVVGYPSAGWTVRTECSETTDSNFRRCFDWTPSVVYPSILYPFLFSFFPFVFIFFLFLFLVRYTKCTTVVLFYFFRVACDQYDTSLGMTPL